MPLTTWDTHPLTKTSAVLFAETLPEHYAILKKYFSSTDVVLDVGRGDNSFIEYIPNANSVDYTTDLTTYDLSSYNTLHFSESIGYMSHEVLQRLVTDQNIKKVVVKDFLTNANPEGIKEFSNYDFTTLQVFFVPLLEQSGYTVNINQFFPNIKRFNNTMKKLGINYVNQGKRFFVKSWYPLELTMTPVIVTATRQ